jgi:3-oxo-5alpha-steroid 4-dehydrogenase
MSGETQSVGGWDDEVDIIIVGFGAAGASAAIEAADHGSDVLIVERFNGGGATKASGGIVYAGGGTTYQKEAGFDDTPENMFNYLKIEVQDAVTDAALRDFCEQSRHDLAWLEEQGVRFDSTLCPFKTSYPPGKYYLYYSGNESFPPYNHSAAPAPRGHRPKGKGMPGNSLFTGLRASAIQKGVKVKCQARATRLLTDAVGRIIGLEFSAIPEHSIFNLAHRLLSHVNYRTRYAAISYPPLNRVFRRLFGLLELRGRKTRVRAREGVILAAGGFVFNREMILDFAPQYLPGPPLGSIGDDGSGIKLGEAVGGATARMSCVSAWRFITPPEDFVKGILVDRHGARVCNEQLYGAQIGRYIVREHEGKAWLVIDSNIRKIVHRNLIRGKTRWFQTLTALGNLYFNIKRARSIAALAQKCGIAADGLEATIESYNETARNKSTDAMGKAAHHVQEIKNPPYYAIDCSLGNMKAPCATITLGGLAVDEKSSQVKREDGSLIEGLYAVGRNAAGIPSNGYVSGLAIADCVFTGRRAARHAVSNRTDEVFQSTLQGMA